MVNRFDGLTEVTSAAGAAVVSFGMADYNIIPDPPVGAPSGLYQHLVPHDRITGLTEVVYPSLLGQPAYVDDHKGLDGKDVYIWGWSPPVQSPYAIPPGAYGTPGVQSLPREDRPRRSLHNGSYNRSSSTPVSAPAAPQAPVHHRETCIDCRDRDKGKYGSQTNWGCAILFYGPIAVVVLILLIQAIATRN